MIDANKLMRELYNESESYRALAEEGDCPYYNLVAISLMAVIRSIQKSIAKENKEQQ
jgi:hypothetical protein